MKEAQNAGGNSSVRYLGIWDKFKNVGIIVGIFINRI
jgi:hypothetical protein